MRKNYCDWCNIKDALNEALGEFDFSILRPYLWKDEINDIFLLTRYMEIYLYNKSILSCYCWSYRMRSQLIERGLISNLWATDDGIHTFDLDIKNLSVLIALGKPFKRRPYINGNWIKTREEKLGHKIKPFRPLLQKRELPETINDKDKMQEHSEECVLA